MDNPAIHELYRDAHLLVVNKPSGLPTQGTRKGGDDLWGLLRRQESYVGLHHRLDQPVSGAVLFTLQRSANAAIAGALRDRTLKRAYLAVLAGEAEDGVWDWPLQGKEAHTTVEVLSRSGGWSAVRIHLNTGRKHQVRQHAAMAGLSVVGDRRYGGEVGRAWPRIALHAWTLGVSHPISGKAIQVTAPLPEDLRPLWERIRGSTGVEPASNV